MKMHTSLTPRPLNILVVLNFCLVALALAAPWLPDTVWPNHLLIKWVVAACGSALLLMLTLWRLPYKKTVSLYISWVKSCFLLLFLLGAASVFWSINTDFTISKWLLWWVGFGTFFTAYHWRPNAQELVGFAWGLMGLAALVACIGIVQYWWQWITLAQYAPPASTFGNRNIATHVIVLTLPAGLYLLSSSKINVLQTWLVAFIMALVLAYIAYTQTRSSWLAVVFQVLVISAFLCLKRPQLSQYIDWCRTKTIACWVCLGIFLVLINRGPEGWQFFFASALERISDANTGHARLSIWGMTLAMVSDNPLLGSGLGTWYQNEIQEGYARTSGMDFLRAHNDLLELATELGLVGVALLITGALAITVAVLAMLNHGEVGKRTQTNKVLISNDTTWFCCLLWVALAGSFVQMQFTFPYQEPVPIFLLGLYIGVIARYSEAFLPAIKNISMPISLYTHWALRSILVVITVGSLCIYAHWMDNNQLINQRLAKPNTAVMSLPTPYIYPNYYLFELRFLSQLSEGDTTANARMVKTIETQALDYWPNNARALENLLTALIKLKDYEQAWIVIERLKALNYQGYYFTDFAELSIYRNTNNADKFIATFMKLLNEEEASLAHSKSTYRNLLRRSLDRTELMQFTEMLYHKSVQYHGYDCDTEQNIATYRWSIQAYAKAVQHLDTIKTSHDASCLKPIWTERLNKNQLAIMLNQARQK